MAIEFNYEKAIKQAKEVEKIAAEMLDEANKNLQPTIDSIGVCWRGEASQQFIQYCNSARDDIKTQVKNLNDLARRIRETAEAIKKAEERAKAEADALAAAGRNLSSGASGSGAGSGLSSGGSGGGGGSSW